MGNVTGVGTRQIVLGLAAATILLLLLGAAIYGLSLIQTGSLGGAIAGGLVAILVALASKAYEHQKQRDSVIAEKKREVYRRLLEPWQKVLANIKTGKEGDDLLAHVDLGSIYASAFDTVLYGSERVVERFVEFRSPNASRDGIDILMSFADLLTAMREDVTEKKTTLPAEVVVGTFVNLTEEERLLLRLRAHAAKLIQLKDQNARRSNTTDPT